MGYLLCSLHEKGGATYVVVFKRWYFGLKNEWSHRACLQVRTVGCTAIGSLYKFTITPDLFGAQFPEEH